MMQAEKAYKVRDTHFPLRIFGMIFGSLLLIGGFHTQIVVMFDIYDNRLNEYLQVAIIIIYWVLTSVIITLFIKKQIKKVFEEPMKQMAEAAGKVAKGDFSVYLPPHSHSRTPGLSGRHDHGFQQDGRGAGQH